MHSKADLLSRDTMNSKDKREGHRCIATCIGIGCQNQIHYDADDDERPLYCKGCRTETGRHSEMKQMKHDAPTVPVEYVFRCPRDQHSRVTAETEPRCKICNTIMTRLGEVK